MPASFNRAALAIVAGATAAFFVGISPATAQETEVIVRGLLPGTKMQLVSYRDLNLNLIAHRKILDKRVGRAVHGVCKSLDARDTLMPDYRACANSAWAGARPQIARAYVRHAQLAYYRRR